MLTPFQTDRRIDWNVYDDLIEYYLRGGSSGLFATCLSSETPELTTEECLQLVHRAVDRVNGRVPVAAGALCKNAPSNLPGYVKEISQAGASAVVLTVNQFAKADETEEVLKSRLFKFFEQVDESIVLGLYECPYPYHRTISPPLLESIARTGRVRFFKDTCSDIDIIRKKLAAVKGSPLQLYNANDLTLTESIQAGASGYSGVGANFFCEPYVWRCRFPHDLSETTRQVFGLANFMQVLITPGGYPAAAKYFLGKCGLSIGETCRVDSIISDGLRDALDLLWERWGLVQDMLRPVMNKKVADS
jgi:4-hydroxy-tetrahydrodipicolinate synthase